MWLHVPTVRRWEIHEWGLMTPRQRQDHLLETDKAHLEWLVRHHGNRASATYVRLRQPRHTRDWIEAAKLADVWDRHVWLPARPPALVGFDIWEGTPVGVRLALPIVPLAPLEAHTPLEVDLSTLPPPPDPPVPPRPAPSASEARGPTRAGPGADGPPGGS